MVSILPHIVRHLSSTYAVVQTYAALTIERFLTVKDRLTASSGQTIQQNRLTKEHFTPVLNDLFTGLFGALSSEVGDNMYVIKCVMRVLVLVGSEIGPVSSLVKG